MAVDDLGHALAPPSPAERVVSLVPSLTEALASVRPDAVVGCTDWCTHPADLPAARVRGTKNPDLKAVMDLRPDLVIANKEENRELDVQRLRESGIEVWVTDINSLDDAFRSLERLFVEAVGWPVPSWLAQAQAVWAEPPRLSAPRVGAAIWRDPWMVVGAPSFADDVLRRLGAVNPFASRAKRYPHVDVEEIRAAGLDVLLLPDEPYLFTPSDGPEAFADLPTALVSGRLLTWYGPSLVSARDHLESAIRQARSLNP